MSALAFAFGAMTGAVAVWSLTPRRRSGHIRVNEDGHWEFPIDTLAQMLAIPVERRGRFLAELPQMFRRMWEIIDKYPSVPLLGNMWVDDSLGELRPHVVNAPKNCGNAFVSRKLEPDGASSSGRGGAA